MIIPSKGLTDKGECYSTQLASDNYHCLTDIGGHFESITPVTLCQLGANWEPQAVPETASVHVLQLLEDNKLLYLRLHLYSLEVTGFISNRQIEEVSYRFGTVRLANLDNLLASGNTPEMAIALVKSVEEIKLAAKLLEL